MVKDAHDDPYRAQIRPFVLPCAECGETARIKALRVPDHLTLDTPFEPLCQDCLDIHLRVWGKERLAGNQPPEQDVLYGVETAPGAEAETVYLTVCSRCNGTGQVFGDRMCFGCMGYRWMLLDPKGVRRTARWWQTYQQNRTNGALTQTRKTDQSPPAP